MENNIPKFASMSEVVMKKKELIDKLVQNKAKHDVILANAIAGYWELAKEKLEARRIQFLKTITEYQEGIDREIGKINQKIDNKETLPSHLSIAHFSLDTNLGLVYPQDHSRDYDRAIALMEASIYEDVQLSVDEFDAYVLNNWGWKVNFLSTNAVYVDTIRNKFKKLNMPIGAAGPQGPAGNRYGRAYDEAVNICMTGMMYSGCSLGANNF